jgi:PHD/YefM family antitoxin component YafN of YafNO toxin-antitoxin module
MVQRVITADNLEADWKTVRESMVSPDDAVIVEVNGEPRFAIVSFDRYKRTLDTERQERLAIARQKWEALAASIGDRNSDLTPEMIEEMASRDWEEPEPTETPDREGSIRPHES